MHKGRDGSREEHALARHRTDGPREMGHSSPGAKGCLIPEVRHGRTRILSPTH